MNLKGLPTYKICDDFLATFLDLYNNKKVTGVYYITPYTYTPECYEITAIIDDTKLRLGYTLEQMESYGSMDDFIVAIEEFSDKQINPHKYTKLGRLIYE